MHRPGIGGCRVADERSRRWGGKVGEGAEGRGRSVTSENNDTAGGGHREAARAGVSPGAWGWRKKSWPRRGYCLIDEVRMGAQTCHEDSRIACALWAVIRADPRPTGGAGRSTPSTADPHFRTSFRGLL